MSKMHFLIPLLFLSSCVSEKSERVLFNSSRDGNSNIYLMDSEGTLQQITNDSTDEWAATWINDETISFLRQEESEIVRIALDLTTGKETTQSHPANCLLDDKNILYNQDGSRGIYPCKGSLFLVDVSTNDITNITENMDGISAYPSWGPDGTYVVFTNNQGGANNVYRLTLADLASEILVESPANDERGAISPDGQYLVYSSNAGNSDNQDLYLKDLSTGNTENITRSKGNELIARWSLNSRQLYFGSNTDGNWEIYRYDLHAKESTRLTFDPGFDGDPRIF